MKARIALFSCALFFSVPSQAIELSGNIASELRYFPDEPVFFEVPARAIWKQRLSIWAIAMNL